jgi:glycerophosphoryl diester phosphodiesterase
MKTTAVWNRLQAGSYLPPICVALLISSVAFAAEDRPVVIAHRGASGYLPEHTLPAKALAHAMGADYLEQDIVLTKDGVPLVMHDIQIDTVTDVAKCFPDRHRANGHFYAIDFTMAEVRQLHATERFDPKTGEAVFKGRFPIWQSTFSIPTLEEELQFIQGLNRSSGRVVGIYPEIKSPAWHRAQGQDISAIALKILSRYGYASKADKFYLQCFDFDEVKRVRTELGFKGKLVQLVGSYGGGEVDGNGVEDPKSNVKLLTREGFAEIAKVANGVGPTFAQIANARKDGAVKISDVVRLAHEAGLVVHPYTFRVDALPKYTPNADAFFDLYFRQAGVDGAFCDQPDLAVAFLKKLAH